MIVMMDHLDEFNKLMLDLKNINIDIKNENRALIILSLHPNSEEHFVDILLYER